MSTSIDIDAFSLKELKAFILQADLSIVGCLDKADLRERAREALASGAVVGAMPRATFSACNGGAHSPGVAPLKATAFHESAFAPEKQQPSSARGHQRSKPQRAPMLPKSARPSGFAAHKSGHMSSPSKVAGRRKGPPSPKSAANAALAQATAAEEEHFMQPANRPPRPRPLPGQPLSSAVLSGAHLQSSEVLRLLFTTLAEPITVAGVETLFGARFLQIAQVVCRAWFDAAASAMSHGGVLVHKGTISRSDGWTPFCTAALPDGRLIASDSAGRQLLLLSTFGAPHGVVRFESTFGSQCLLRDPRGVVATPATYEEDGCTLLIYVVDRSASASDAHARVLRAGVLSDGREVTGRLQFGPDPRLRDPQELVLSADASTLFVSDPGQVRGAGHQHLSAAPAPLTCTSTAHLQHPSPCTTPHPAPPLTLQHPSPCTTPHLHHPSPAPPLTACLCLAPPRTASWCSMRRA